MKSIGLILGCVLLLTMTSCTAPTSAQIAAGISAVTPIATQKMFSSIAKRSPAAATQAAVALSAFIKSDIIPWINGAPIPATDFVTQLESKFLSKLNDPGYEAAVAVIVGTLTANLNLSSPAMSDVEKQYALALAVGVSQGADIFASGKVAHLDGHSAPPTLDELKLQVAESRVLFVAPKKDLKIASR